MGEEAARTLAGSHDPRVATLLHSIAAESSTPAPLKTAAYMASQQVAIRADLGQSTTIVYAAQPGGTPIETPEFKGGLFTHFLLADLQEDRDFIEKGQLQTDRIYATLSEQISHYRNEQGDVVIPLIESTGDRTVPLIPATCAGSCALMSPAGFQ